MSILRNFRRCNRKQPCPTCGKPDWCLIGRSGTEFEGTTLCQRVNSATRFGDAGCLHRASGVRPAPRRDRTWSVSTRVVDPDRFENFAERARRVGEVLALKVASRRLGITKASLFRLGMGIVTQELAESIECPWALDASTFPMRAVDGSVVGIRLRHPDGRKTSVPDSRQGLFLPAAPESDGRLFICEGPTDTGAVLDLGLMAIGLPFAKGRHVDAVELAVNLNSTSVVVCADNDDVGLEGARSLAAALATRVPDVRVLIPHAPHKDMRDWILAGADKPTILGQVEALRPLSVTLRRIHRPGPPNERI